MEAWVQIPERVVDEHIRWHENEGQPEHGGRRSRRGEAGSGQEFLEWHADYLKRYQQWRRANGLAKITPWRRLPKRVLAGGAIPSQLNPPDLPSYPSLDALGMALESLAHAILHAGVATSYSDPALGTFASPLSISFWKLHGLIESWRRRWNEQQSMSLARSFQVRA